MCFFLGTQRDNVHDMVRKGRDNKASGSANGFAKLTEDQVKQIKIDLAKGFSQASIARLHNVGKSCIHLIATGQQWRKV